jgi:hypothetical protein
MISPLSFLFLSFSLSSLPQQPRERKRKQEEELVLRWSKYINKNNNQNINSSIKATHNLRPKKSRQQTRRENQLDILEPKKKKERKKKNGIRFGCFRHTRMGVRQQQKQERRIRK